jgi:Protein of unknown function (DUF3313)
MRSAPTTLRAVTVAAAALLVSGCVTTPPPPLSGFLGDYTGLARDPTDRSLLWWEREGFDWSRYRGVILDPVNIYYYAEGESRDVKPDELEALRDSFREAVVAELGTRYAVSNAPSPDVLRVRCAITGVVPVRPALNAFTSALAFVPFDVGGASIEVEFLDSVTGERLAAGVDQKRGKRIDGTTSFKRLAQAEQAFRDWAKDLRAALDTNP